MYPLLFRALKQLSPETAHHVAFGSLGVAFGAPEIRGLVRSWLAPAPALGIDALGLRFPGPLGLAAGFDKNADAPDALSALGFGSVEIGTVTGEPQPGNDRPRLFRLVDDHALLNRMGFNNDGAERVRERLARRPRDVGTILGVNIGKTKVVENARAHEDYARSARLLGAFADYAVVNVSSPNTPGLRALQSENELARILTAARGGLDASGASRRVPLLVKIAPDLPDEQVHSIAVLARDFGLDGIIATNTTIARDGLRTPGVAELGAGGVSGRPVAARALEVLDVLHAAVGRDLVLVSVGGIENADQAFERILHGATLLQLYTAFVYEGPLVAHRIHTGLAERLRDAGYATLAQAIGTHHTA